MTWVPDHQFTIACGAGGAFVDVTALGHVLTDQGGIVRSWGRQSSFNDFTGGTFAFTLDNRDGRYTPDSTTAGATPLVEGMRVVWRADTRLVSGKISVSGLQMIFPDPGTAESARIRVTVGDMLVESGRHTLGGLGDGLVRAGSPYLYYPLNESSGAVSAAETSGNSGIPLSTGDVGGYTFGDTSTSQVGDSGLHVTGGATFQAVSNNIAISYPAGSRGVWSFWFVAGSASVGHNEIIIGNIGNVSVIFNITMPTFFVEVDWPSGIAEVGPFPLDAGAGAFLEAVVTYTLSGGTYTVTLSVYVNDVLVGTSSGTSTTAPTSSAADVVISAESPNDVTFARLSHTPNRVRQALAGYGTEATFLTAVALTTPGIILGSLSGLSTQPLGVVDTSGSSALDAFNNAMRTEQGQLFTTTTGTVTAPVQTINFRGRDRPADVTAVWDAKADLQSDAQFVRDLSNTVSEVDATGIGANAVVIGKDLIPKVGSANIGFAVLNSDTPDVLMAGSDRLNRGRKFGLDIPSITIDGLRIQDPDRSADLLGLALGDRHQVAGLPTAQLGYSTWDAFLIGVNELWDSVTGYFTLNFEPAGAPIALFDTARFSAGGALHLSSAITSSAISMSVATSVPASGGAPATLLSTTETPYDLLIDAEIVTVTAVTTATPQVATIVRAQGDTVAATHSSGALVDITPLPRFAY